jgi:hypothetical protein
MMAVVGEGCLQGEVKNTDHVLHWVRPGLLSCVVVLSNGQIRIWSCVTSRQEFYWSDRRTSISGFSDATLGAADIMTGPQQTLRLATVRMGEPVASVTVSELRGDPTADSAGKGATKLTVAKIANVPMGTSTMGAALLSVHFDPSKSGRQFMCILDDKVRASLSPTNALRI